MFKGGVTLKDRKWLLMKRLQKRDYELDVNLRGSVSPSETPRSFKFAAE